MISATLPVSFATATTNGISTSQTPAGAGNLTITGSLASGGVATLTPLTGMQERQVLISCAGNDTARTFTVYGTNGQGLSISEAVAGSNGSTSVTTSYFQTVTRVAVDAATAGAVTVGTNGVGASQPWVPDNWSNPISISLAFEVSGTINCSIQHTYDDVYISTGYGALTWFDHVANRSTNIDSTITSPVTAVRLKQNSFTNPGSANLVVVQAGPL